MVLMVKKKEVVLHH